MTRRRKVSAVNPRILRVMRNVSRRLDEQNIAHALIGGLAVNRYGYERATADVDFIVTRDACEALTGNALGGEVYGKTIQVKGVIIDLVFPKQDEEFLEAQIRRSSAGKKVPLIPEEALIYMKLVAGRMKDTADVVELLKRGKIDVSRTTSFLKKHRPDLVEDFEALVSQAQVEAD